MMKIAVISLGCNKNLVDSEIMMGYLTQAGWQLTNDEAQADVIIVNTCGFITSAKEEAINTVFDALEYKKQSCRAVIATGCLVKRYSRELAEQIPELDGLLGVYDYAGIVQAVKDALAGKHPVLIGGDAHYLDTACNRVLSGAGYSAYLKIAEGCANRCHYCAIPSIRGNYVSRSMQSLLTEAKLLKQSGVKELIVTAQDTTRYGEDTGKNRFCELLSNLDAIGFDWIRVLYAYPSRVSRELLELMDNSRHICHYLDIPIQHTQDKMLAAMNRHYRSDKIIEIHNTVSAFTTPWALRTTVIVGYPGETAKDFAAMMDFISKYRFDLLGAFEYSPEEGTVGAGLKHQTRAATKQVRYDSIMLRQGEITNSLLARFAGKTQKVLTEGFDQQSNRYYGRNEFQAPEIDGKVYFTSKRRIDEGEFVSVHIDDTFSCDLYGEEVDE